MITVAFCFCFCFYAGTFVVLARTRFASLGDIGADRRKGKSGKGRKMEYSYYGPLLAYI